MTHGIKTDKNYCKKCKQPYTETHDACPRDYKNPNKVQEKFVCTQCNGTYSSKQYLREHIETVHEGKDKYFPIFRKNYEGIVLSFKFFENIFIK